MPDTRRGLDHVSPSIEPAIARFARLSRVGQMRVLAEILTTRSTELARACDGVIRIGMGQRRRRDTNRRASIDKRAPLCVLFMVAKKWRTRVSCERAGAIPRHLLAYATIRGVRRLVAVPTDVDAHWLERPRAHEAIQARTDGSGAGENGEVCCVVRASTGARFGISPRHVLSMGDFARVSRDYVVEAGERIGVVVDTRGPSTGEDIMDAQLFRITRPAAALPRFAGRIDASDIPRNVRHTAPSLAPSARNAECRGLWRSGLDVTLDPATEWMFAGELLEVELSAPTSAGDSGSAVTTRESPPRLVGMHIGRSTKMSKVSICVPAWRLLDSTRYEGPQRNVAWRLE